MTEAEARADARFPALVQKYRDYVSELWHGDSPWSPAHFEQLAVRELLTGKIPMHGFRKDAAGDVYELVPGEAPKKLERQEAPVKVRKGLKNATKWAREKTKPVEPCPRCGSTSQGCSGACRSRHITEPAHGEAAAPGVLSAMAQEIVQRDVKPENAVANQGSLFV